VTVTDARRKVATQPPGRVQRIWDARSILVDEVLAVGDKAFRVKCYDRIDELLSGGTTLFLVSHSAADLRRFCKRGIYLRNGEMRGDGPVDEIIDRYEADLAAIKSEPALART
jgi:ABC-2 type transport system ATP-binding protein